MKYTEDISKNRPGGLKGRKATPKVVIHHANTDKPQRCFVRLFKLYTEKCPSDAPPRVLYLRPATSTEASGHTKLSGTVARLCRLAGIPGFKTNHSLRATATSRLYHHGVEEQLVMEPTGHRRLEGVRSYKRTSNTQRQSLSNILNQQKTPGCTSSTDSSSITRVNTSLCNTQVSTLQSNQQLVAGLSLPSAVFERCTVNFYMAPGNGSNSTKRARKRAFIESDSDSD